MKMYPLYTGAAVLAVALTAATGCGAATNDTAAPPTGAAVSSAVAECAAATAADAKNLGNPLGALNAAVSDAVQQSCPGYWTQKCAELTNYAAELATATALPPGLSAARRAMSQTLRDEACEKAK